MLAFGAIAYIMRRLGFPLAPMVLGIVLGSLLDEFLRNALIISGGSLMPLLTRPIAFGLFIVLILTVVTSLPVFRRLVGRFMNGERQPVTSSVGEE